MSLDTSGIPLPGAAPRGRELIASLGNGSFRVFLASQFFATMALWGQRIATDWVLLEMTGSVTLVGMLVVFQFGPTLLLGMWGGVLVDRYSTKLLLLASQIAALLVNIGVAVLALTGALSPFAIFAAVTVLGLFSIVDQPARQVVVGFIVGDAKLGNAISMNQITYQVAGMIGPVVAGVMLVSPGSGAVFVVASIAHALALVTLAWTFVKARLAPPIPHEQHRGEIADAFRYAWRKPEIRYTMILLVFVCVVGLNWPLVFVSMATMEFHSGAEGYGYANAAIAAGSLVGGILSLRRVHRGLSTVIVGIGGLSAFRVICGVAPVEWIYLIVVAGTGVWSLLMWTAANSLLQWSSNTHIRGRIMSLYMLIAVGGQALGGPLLGWACEVFGPRAVFIVSGLIPLAATFVILALARRERRGR